jgi:hypothetical protein
MSYTPNDEKPVARLGHDLISDKSEEEQLQILRGATESVEQMENTVRETGISGDSPLAVAPAPLDPTAEPVEPEPQEGESSVLQTAGEIAASIPTGVLDFVVDYINPEPSPDPNSFLHALEVPKVPKFQNDIAQTVRELSSVIVPTAVLTSKGQAAGAAANAQVAWGIGQSALVKWLGNTGIAAGAGAYVDATARLNETDDNLQGSLKKMFPKTFSWISDDWATLDTDSPDIKRAKNVNEGVGLGIFSDLLLGAAKLTRASFKTKALTKVVPENEQAVKWVNGNVVEEPDDIEEIVMKSMQSREDALDEIGQYNLSKATDLNEPLFGVHDVYGLEEDGIRTVDRLGVVGASIDQVAISKNINTVHGRLGSIVSEAALKLGANLEDLNKRTIIKLIANEVKAAGKYGAELPNGAKISYDEIDKAGTRLAEILMDPRMDTGMLKGTLDEFKEFNKGIEGLSAVGYNAARKTIKKYMDEFLNLDTLKAQAYLTTSLAGQVADIAEGARYMEGTAAIERAHEQIIDRIEYLMVETGLASFAKNNSISFINNLKKVSDDPKKLAKIGENAVDNSEMALTELVRRAKNTSNSLRYISTERPDLLEPFVMAWEFTDGNIDTISKLNRFIENSLGTLNKAVLDTTPEIPSVIVQGAWANIYNSILTNIGTPLKAGFSNLALLMERPVAAIAGAATAGDMKAIRRGWYQYSALLDSTTKGLKHMSHVFTKASTDPMSVGYIMRDDIARKNEATMDILHSFAKAAEAEGNSGPMALYLTAEALHDLSMNPVLRFGTNAMAAFDGFTRSVIANVEARGRVYDKFIDADVPLTGKALKEANDEVYNSMFDKSGMITDKAVEYASREISMNLDSPAATALGTFIEKYPGLKPFLMFPKTSMNVLDMANKHSPWSVFAKDYNRIAYAPLEQISRDEMAEILTSRGLPVNADEFLRLRYEMRGRKAIGTISLTAAFGMLAGGNLRGTGHYDKSRQATRRELGWQPKTYRGLDGKWHSYEWLGPIGDFLALAADVFDNFDSITENDAQTMWAKLSYVMAASVTNRSALAGLEPMNDVLSGNPAAANRWAASFVSSFAPLSGARNELGRLLYPQLRELDQDFFQLMRNRNKWMDGIDPNNALPDAHDWISGEKVGYPEDIFVRILNAVTPFKVAEKISPERQFLMDIEYDNRPSFRTNGKGVEYTPQERSELYSIMGRQKIFKAAIEQAMATTTAKAWRDRIKKARGKGASIDPTEWENLYNSLDKAMYTAVKAAETELSNRDEVLLRQYEASVDKQAQRAGVPVIPMLKNK